MKVAHGSAGTVQKLIHGCEMLCLNCASECKGSKLSKTRSSHINATSKTQQPYRVGYNDIQVEREQRAVRQLTVN